MKLFFKKIATFALLLSALTLSAKDYKDVKYVFLFIGDGMSIPQRMATEEFLKTQNLSPLAINKMPYQTPTTTRSASSFITDSAASGTAIACGEKVPNKYIGVTAKNKKLVSIADVAKKEGMKVGIITSVTLNHATPAAFYAHSSARSNYYKIGLDLIESGFDFFGGGTIAKRNDKKSPLYKGDILELAPQEGYKVAIGRSNIEAITKNDGKVIAIANERDSLPYFIDAPKSMRISHILEKAIEVLDNDKGFFIMTEGGKIDWMCHANDAATTIREVIDMDNAVKVAVEFAKKHPNETLIVVTGDHETGGLTLGFAGTGYSSYIYLLANQKCSQGAFEGEIKKLLKSNPNASFDEAKLVITECFGLTFGSDNKKSRLHVSSAEEDILRAAFEREKRPTKKSSKGKEKYEAEKNPLSVATIRLFNNKAGIAWTSTAHTALPVITSAQGVNAEAFTGMLDNTDIAKILKDIID